MNAEREAARKASAEKRVAEVEEGRKWNEQRTRLEAVAAGRERVEVRLKKLTARLKSGKPKTVSGGGIETNRRRH